MGTFYTLFFQSILILEENDNKTYTKAFELWDHFHTLLYKNCQVTGEVQKIVDQLDQTLKQLSKKAVIIYWNLNLLTTKLTIQFHTNFMFHITST